MLPHLKIKRLALLLAIVVIVEVQPIYFWEFGTPGTLEVKSLGRHLVTSNDILRKLSFICAFNTY